MNSLEFSAMINGLNHIGPWEITGRISNGAFGIVFSAQRRRVDKTLQTAAIKLITPEGMNNEQYRAMFVHEFRVLQGLSSKYIPGVVDSGIEQVQVGSRNYDLQWFAMDEIRGDNLDEELERLGPLDEHLWLELAHDLLSALAVTHSNRLIHQDIKPANVMRFSRHSVLVDFGGASFVHFEDPGDIGVYTLGFCAPEQISSDVDPSQHEYPIDIFAVGATLAYAGTKVMPWSIPLPDGNVKNEREAHLSVRTELRNRLMTTEPNLFGFSDSVTTLLKQMLDPVPSQRPTADKALQIIKDLLPEGTPRKTEVISDAARQTFINEPTTTLSAEEISRIFESKFDLLQRESTAKDGHSGLLCFSRPRPNKPEKIQVFWVFVGKLFTYIDAPFAVKEEANQFLDQIIDETKGWGTIGIRQSIALHTTIPTKSVIYGDDFSTEFHVLLEQILKEALLLEYRVLDLYDGKVATLKEALPIELPDETSTNSDQPSGSLGKKNTKGLKSDAPDVSGAAEPKVKNTPRDGLNKKL